MQREPELWLRKANATFYVKIDGRQIPLGKDEREARIARLRLLLEQLTGEPEPEPAGNSVRYIVIRFLWELRETVRSGKTAQRTLDFYREHLQRFLDFCRKHEPEPIVSVGQVKVHVITAFLNKRYKASGSTHQNCAVRSVKRAFAYATQQEWIDRNPVKAFKTPAAESRECSLEPEQLQHVLDALTESDFSDAIRFLILTGARPYEMRTAAAGDVNREGHAITFTRKGSKGKKHRRTITLSDSAWALVERRLAKSGGGLLFVNKAGNPWTAFALNCGCRRLAKLVAKKLGKTVAKSGEPAGPNEFPYLFPYLFRHQWATDSLKAEIDSETVSKMMGHKDGTMVSRVYSHIAGQGQYLRSVANKIDEARRLA